LISLNVNASSRQIGSYRKPRSAHSMIAASPVLQ